MHKIITSVCVCVQSQDTYRVIPRNCNSNRRYLLLLHIMCLSSMQGRYKEKTMIGTYHVVYALSFSVNVEL